MIYKEKTKYEFYTFEGQGEYHNIKMDPAENLPNNVFFIDKNNADDPYDSPASFR